MIPMRSTVERIENHGETLKGAVGPLGLDAFGIHVLVYLPNSHHVG